MTHENDFFHWGPVAKLERWDDTASYEAGDAPDSVDVYEGNLMLNAGLTRLNNLLIGAGGTAFNSTNARIGVGISNTAASAGQTDLQGASKRFNLVDSISNSGQVITAVATFGSSDANFAWEEWGIDNGTASGNTVTAPLLNRKVVTMGTKASGSTWVLTVTITTS